MNKPFFAGSGDSFDIVFQHGLHQRVARPLLVLRGQTFDLIQHEPDLKRQRRFWPQGAIIIKYDVAFFGRNKR